MQAKFLALTAFAILASVGASPLEAGTLYDFDLSGRALTDFLQERSVKDKSPFPKRTLARITM